MSFTLTTSAVVKMWREKSIRVCLGSIIHLYIFLYSDSVTFLSFVFVLQKKIYNSDKAIRKPRGLLSLRRVM